MQVIAKWDEKKGRVEIILESGYSAEEGRKLADASIALNQSPDKSLPAKEKMFMQGHDENVLVLTIDLPVGPLTTEIQKKKKFRKTQKPH